MLVASTSIERTCRCCGKSKPLVSFKTKAAGRRSTSCRQCERATVTGRAARKRQDSRTLPKRAVKRLRSGTAASTNKLTALLACENLERHQRLIRMTRKRDLSPWWCLLQSYTDVCPLTGVKIDWSAPTAAVNPFGPSIDKIDQTKPYSDTNARVISHWANTARWVLSDADFLAMCRKTVNHHADRSTTVH